MTHGPVAPLGFRTHTAHDVCSFFIAADTNIQQLLFFFFVVFAFLFATVSFFVCSASFLFAVCPLWANTEFRDEFAEEKKWNYVTWNNRIRINNSPIFYQFFFFFLL